MSANDPIADILDFGDNDVMKRIDNRLTKVLRRWSNQQTSALHQMSERKTLGQRFAAFHKSERADAKFLLLGMLPIVPVIFWDEMGWQRGTLWHLWFWFSMTWLVVVGGYGFGSYGRALIRVMRRK